MAFPTQQVHRLPAPTSQEYLWVSTDGDDTNGDGTMQNPYATPGTAMGQVSATRKHILVLPGNYSDSFTWSTTTGMHLIGLSSQWDTSITDDEAGDEVITVAPGAQTATWEMWIENIYLIHTTAGQDGLKLNHTSVGKKLNCYLRNFGADADSDSDKSITVTHGGSGNAVRIYMRGDNGGIAGAVYFQSKDNSDRLWAEGAHFDGGIELSTDATTLSLRLISCMVKHEGITGGSTSTVVDCMHCQSVTGTTYAQLDTDDVAGNITGENVFP